MQRNVKPQARVTASSGISKRRLPSWAARTAEAIVKLLKMSTIVFNAPSGTERYLWA